MIMVGLSLLGLGFVALSPKQSAISVNERNYTPGPSHRRGRWKHEVVEWFQGYWTLAAELMPANQDAIKG